MIHFLRHYTARLWASLILTSLAVLIGFPVIGGQQGPWLAFWAALAGFLVFFFLVGWIGNTLGIRWIGILMREAGIWERAGNFRRSGKILKKAVSIFDSFLISPVAREAYSREISSRMARSYLSQPEPGPQAEGFVVAYLQRHPEDAEASDMWLEKSGSRGNLPGKHEDLVFALSDAQPENKDLQRMLAHACLRSERSDYQAIKIYKRIIEDPAPGDRGIVDDIAWRFYHDRRTDRLALQAYLTAFKADTNKKRLLVGMAACVERLAVGDRTSRTYQEAAKLISRLDETTLAKMRANFAPSPPQTAAAPDKKEALKTIARTLRTTASALSATLISARRATIGAYASLYHHVKTHRLTRPVSKWAVLGLAGAILVVLVINTAGHLISSQKTLPPPEPKPPAAIEVTDPFTLQVAAYLKMEHAEKFVATLKSMGEDAYYTEARSSKSNWFQVRISHFPTKEAARSHGEALKSKGIIDDFYVANYQKPGQKSE
ncbi:MAG: SPOR domain-containing protein [Deltaproteobacteria bacterium]|nr:SPOR domain-containing protein [Deltaproteobacteria bacterium]